jgi:hypothetical protein
MSRRKKIIIIIAIVLGILAIVLLVLSLGQWAPLFNRNINEKPPVVGGKYPGGGDLNAAVNINASPSILTKEPSTQSTLMAVAMTFAERFGSFSSESNFENIRDLEVMMTDKMQDWTDSFIAKNQDFGGEFYGIITRVLNVEIINLADDESQAQVLVSTQREETRGGVIKPRVFYQKILLNLVQENGNWKVDSATWQ